MTLDIIGKVPLSRMPCRNNNRVAKKEEKNIDEKPSLLGRLKEKQEQLSSGAKKDVLAQSKKSERDMQ